MDRQPLSSYTKLILVLAGSGTDNALGEPQGVDEGRTAEVWRSVPREDRVATARAGGRVVWDLFR